MPRPKNDVPVTRVNMWIPTPTVERIDRLAKTSGITRTTAIRMLVTRALNQEEQAELMVKMISTGKLDKMLRQMDKAEEILGKNTGKFPGQQELDLDEDEFELEETE